MENKPVETRQNTSNNPTSDSPERKLPNRFAISPIEIGIFCGISALFLNSVYTLFTDKTAVTVALNPSQMTRGSISYSDQSPSSVNRAIANNRAMEDSQPEIAVDCKSEDAPIIIQTKSEKIRFIGPICQNTLNTAKITSTNQTTAYSATTFLDPIYIKFSTDYIPLKDGNNEVNIEFHEGQILQIKQTYQIIKNSSAENETSESIQ